MIGSAVSREELSTAGTNGFSPFIYRLLDQRTGREDVVGLFHSLTGECFECDRSAFSAAAGAGPSESAAALRDVLGERGLYDDAGDPATQLAPFLDLPLVIPAHTPTLASIRGEHVRIFRPERLSVCALPRSQDIPRVVRESMDAGCGQLLALAQRNVTLGSAIQQSGLDHRRALKPLLELTHPDRQLIRIARQPEALVDLRAQLHYPMQSFEQVGPTVASETHYRDDINDAQCNFDWLEPTVAHAFRRPSTALRGRVYGAAIFVALPAGIGERRPWKVLEVGGGTGELAQGFLRAAAREGVANDRIEYHILDISPGLIEAQQRLLAGRATWHLGDAQQGLPGRFDLVIANEVIAGFDVARGPKGRLEQWGAQAFVRHLAEALRPGGTAVVTEYGGLSFVPEPVAHLGHTEHAVNFGELTRTAKAAGLTARTMPLMDFLNVDRTASMLVAQQERCHCLRAFFDGHDLVHSFEFRAYDVDEFNERFGELTQRHGLVRLTFAPLYTGQHFGPDLRQFLALIVEQAS